MLVFYLNYWQLFLSAFSAFKSIGIVLGILCMITGICGYYGSSRYVPGRFTGSSCGIFILGLALLIVCGGI
jgi:hypothetical protein